jgi:hypothetical protein
VAATFSLTECVARYRRLYTLLAAQRAAEVGAALAPPLP